MELIEALRTTGAVRSFRPDPVPDDVLLRVLDTARFAPSGGNRQAWRVVVVRDPGQRRALRDLYLPGWYEYLAMVSAGLTPWAPVTDRDAEAQAMAKAPELAAAGRGSGTFPETLDLVPVLLVVLADLRRLAAVDRDTGGYTLVGGASIYPFVWSLLLAARGEGLGGVLTTMVVRRQKELLRLLHAPDATTVAAVVALGWPEHQPTRLRREPVASFTTIDACDGQPFGDGLPVGAGS
jgi:nitroreductase